MVKTKGLLVWDIERERGKNPNRVKKTRERERVRLDF